MGGAGRDSPMASRGGELRRRIRGVRAGPAENVFYFVMCIFPLFLSFVISSSGRPGEKGKWKPH